MKSERNEGRCEEIDVFCSSEREQFHVSRTILFSLSSSLFLSFSPGKVILATKGKKTRREGLEGNKTNALWMPSLPAKPLLKEEEEEEEEEEERGRET